ncbi:VOC family protein [Streptomyces sp. NPDC058307]|uniref:VOC family protein n=1 Tax=Streptomyces sp. NPDC058307 TaxID=3346439 RepID=UPI0036E9782B
MPGTAVLPGRSTTTAARQGLRTDAVTPGPASHPCAARAHVGLSFRDIEVNDLSSAVEHALDLGATMADVQPQSDVRVLYDPAGHPFCLFVRSGPGV